MNHHQYFNFEKVSSMDTATVPSAWNLQKNLWHLVKDNGNTYYVSKNKMPCVKDLMGLKSDGSSILKDFIEKIRNGTVCLPSKEKPEMDSPIVSINSGVLEDSVLYSPCRQYASCADCRVLCDVRNKCPLCHRRILLPKISQDPSTIEIPTDISPEDISILPDNILTSENVQRQEKDLERERKTKGAAIKEAQILFVDPNIQHPVSVLEDPHQVLDTPGPSKVTKLLRHTVHLNPSGVTLVKQSPVQRNTAKRSSPAGISLGGPKRPEMKRLKSRETVTETLFAIYCQAVRIGSYECPIGQVHLSSRSVSMEVPPVIFSLPNVKLVLGKSEILNASLRLTKTATTIIFEVTCAAAARVREELQMNSADVDGPWFNPMSKYSAHTKIVLVLKDPQTANSLNSIKQLLKSIKNSKGGSIREGSEASKFGAGSTLVSHKLTTQKSCDNARTSPAVGTGLLTPADGKTKCYCGKCY